MKKKYIVGILLLVAVVAGAVTVNYVSKTEPQTVEDFLYGAGFKTIPNLEGSKNANFWESKYKLHFISDKDMDTLMKANGFAIAPAMQYTYAIPDKAAADMKKNFDNIKEELLIYDFYAYNNGDEDHNKEAIGKLMFTLSGSEVKGNIHDKNRFRGHVYHSVWWNRENKITWAIKKETLSRLSIPYQDIQYWWLMQKNPAGEKIYVVADKNSFAEAGPQVQFEKPAGHLTERKDPLAVIKHRGGWVILAAWGDK